MDMELKELFLAQLEREAAASRKVVDRVPEGRDELNLDDQANEGFRTKAVPTKAELLKRLDEGVNQARKALAETTEEHLMKPWRFIAGGRVQSNQPRHVMLSDAVFAHLAHHRGQLTVYLRLNEASVPAIYGPSADERKKAIGTGSARAPSSLSITKQTRERDE
jgi:hypothetical protein